MNKGKQNIKKKNKLKSLTRKMSVIHLLAVGECGRLGNTMHIKDKRFFSSFCSNKHSDLWPPSNYFNIKCAFLGKILFWFVVLPVQKGKSPPLTVKKWGLLDSGYITNDSLLFKRKMKEEKRHQKWVIYQAVELATPIIYQNTSTFNCWKWRGGS